MKKLFLIFLFSAVLYSSEKVKIKELYENSEFYNGKSIVIEGEAIGEKMGKGDEIWVNIKDEFEDFAIGVVMSKIDIEKIENFGRYRIKGDIVRVEGIYNVNCIKHPGERDIHAIKVEVIKKGERYNEELSLKKIYLSFILLFITVFLIFLYHKKEIKV
jgi:hypothetical protein